VTRDGIGLRADTITLGPVSTRRLIIAALACGLAILIAFTVQVVLVNR
jgi:hypothetical protein